MFERTGGGRVNWSPASLEYWYDYAFFVGLGLLPFVVGALLQCLFGEHKTKSRDDGGGA